MKLYHGTNYKRGKNILDGGKIKCNVARIYNENEILPELVTTNGLVYLTDLIPVAIQYAINADAQVDSLIDDALIYIFEIEISGEELLFDHDQMKAEKIWGIQFSDDPQDYTGKYSLEKTHSVGVNRDLLIGADVIRYSILPAYINSSHKLIEITKKCLQYRFFSNLPLPNCIDQIPWIDL